MSEACISLLNVYEARGAVEILYNLLAERDPAVNISHKAMPTMQQHRSFVLSRPYRGWWLIRARQGGHPIGITYGACYLTMPPRPSAAGNEIGIQIFKEFHRQGIARKALELLLEMHRGERLLANISPMNAASMALFRGFGFRLAQHTYALEVA